MIGLRRLLRIALISIRFRLDTLIDTSQLPTSLALLLRLAPWRLLPNPKRSRGERLRMSLEALGPIFVKFGQLLSTRRDLMPPDIADELARLQDQVPPFSGELATRLIEQALGQSTEELFASFDRQPMASASVAQVHAATLKNGREVVVKVIRPGIQRVIEQDIRLLRTIAWLIERYLPDGRRLRPVEVVEDYKLTVLDELDLQREGANTSQLRRNFEGSDLLYVPEVYWDFTRRNILVMERIDGIPVTDIAALKAQGTDMKALAERGVEIFFTQVFRDSFFHADMHPGNIFVARNKPQAPQYIAIDCAIIGSLSDFDQYYLARNLLAIFQRNYREVAELHVECGWVPPETRVHEFESAIRSVCEPVFEKPLAEISFGQLLVYLFQTARRFDMEVQPSLVLLQKTLLNIEGLGRQLYPELNLWDTAKPYLERWLRDRYSPQSMLKRVSHRLPGWLEQLPNLPENLFDGSRLTPDQPLRQHQHQQRELMALQQQVNANRRASQRGTLAVLAIAGAWLAANPNLLQQHTLPAASWVLIGAAALLLLRRPSS